MKKKRALIINRHHSVMFGQNKITVTINPDGTCGISHHDLESGERYAAEINSHGQITSIKHRNPYYDEEALATGQNKHQFSKVETMEYKDNNLVLISTKIYPEKTTTKDVMMLSEFIRTPNALLYLPARAEAIALLGPNGERGIRER